MSDINKVAEDLNAAIEKVVQGFTKGIENQETLSKCTKHEFTPEVSGNHKCLNCGGTVNTMMLNLYKQGVRDGKQ